MRIGFLFRLVAIPWPTIIKAVILHQLLTFSRRFLSYISNIPTRQYLHEIAVVNDYCISSLKIRHKFPSEKSSLVFITEDSVKFVHSERSLLQKVIITIDLIPFDPLTMPQVLILAEYVQQRHLILRILFFLGLMYANYMWFLQILHHTFVETTELQKESKRKHLLNLDFAYLANNVDLLEVDNIGYVLEEVLFVGRTCLVNSSETNHVVVVVWSWIQRVRIIRIIIQEILKVIARAQLIALSHGLF